MTQEDAVLTALKNMVSMWRTVCSCHGWDPDHLVEYGEALKAIKSAEENIND